MQLSRPKPTAVLAALIAWSLLVPSAWAQQAASIAGVVRDTEGLPIPGVTVETQSPALIQQSVIVFTDGEGRYTVVDLRPGTYVVTFSLTGFSTVRREGIVLTAGFTASVDVALNVGSVEETITVTGAAPVVDTQTIRQQETLTTTDLTALPAGSVGLQTLAYVTPGFATTQADVGGTRDTWSAQGAYTGFHGKTGTRASFDGFRNQYFIGPASGVGYVTDQGIIEELQLETSGMGAESGSGSTNLNVIPKSGGNDLRATVDGFFSNGAMQSSNIDDELRAFDLTTADVDHIYRLGAQLGGPFVRDRVWFFGAVGYWGSKRYLPGSFFNPLQGKSGHPITATLFYPGQPGTGIPASLYETGGRAYSWDWYRNHSLRTTAQLTQRQRVAFFFDYQKSCRCTTGGFGAGNAIESDRGWDWTPSGVVNGTWTMPVSSRLLLEAGASWQTANWVNFAQPNVTRDDRFILELTTGYQYGAPLALTAPKARTGRSAQRFSVSYVTGTHNLKLGVSNEGGFNDEGRDNNHRDGLNYIFAFGRPLALQYRQLPFFQQERQDLELGLFAQDAWTLTDRLTMTYGLRFDWVRMGFPSADLPAGPFTPARHVEGRSGIPDWKDVNPRLGFAYDVFGNGRTAVRFSVGRYNQLSRSDMPRRFHPFTSAGGGGTLGSNRFWNDLTYPEGDPRRGNYTPDCDLNDFGVNGECGPLLEPNFGRTIAGATPDCPTVISCFDDDITKDNRDYLWDYNVEFQHEVTRGLSVSFGYNYNYDGAFQVVDRVNVGPDQHDEFCVQVPADSRIPGGGGYEQCGYYDVNPQSLLARESTRASDSDKFGDYERYWHGITVSANGRLPYGIVLGGGIDAGRNVRDTCFTVDLPNQPEPLDAPIFPVAGPFCREVTSMKDNLDFRVRGSIPIRGGFNVSFIFRNTPGAQIAPTLAVAGGTLLTATGTSVRFVNGRTAPLTNNYTLELVPGNTHYGDRFSQLDLAVAKTFNLQGFGRLRTSVDLYNALNGNSVQSLTNAVGATFLKPTTVLDPRLLRVTASLSF